MEIIILAELRNCKTLRQQQLSEEADNSGEDGWKNRAMSQAPLLLLLLPHSRFNFLYLISNTFYTFFTFVQHFSTITLIKRFFCISNFLLVVYKLIGNWTFSTQYATQHSCRPRKLRNELLTNETMDIALLLSSLRCWRFWCCAVSVSYLTVNWVSNCKFI